MQLEAITEELKAPIKKCAVCREERATAETLRFVRDERGQLHFDPQRKAPGRGVSICAAKKCVEEFRPGLPGVKALGEVLPLDAAFWERFTKTLQSDVLSRLGLLWRQRKLVVGADMTSSAESVALALLANDAGRDAQKAVQSDSARVLPIDAETLGHALGKDRVSVVALGHDDVTKAMGLLQRAILWSELVGFDKAPAAAAGVNRGGIGHG